MAMSSGEQVNRLARLNESEAVADPAEPGPVAPAPAVGAAAVPGAGGRSTTATIYRTSENHSNQ